LIIGLSLNIKGNIGSAIVRFEIYKNNSATDYYVETNTSGNFINTTQSVRFTPADEFDLRIIVTDNPRSIDIVANYTSY
jgi:hypothetical protein